MKLQSYKRIPLFQLFDNQNSTDYYSNFSAITFDERRSRGRNVLEQTKDLDGTLIFNSFINEYSETNYEKEYFNSLNHNNSYIHALASFENLLITDSFSEKIFLSIENLKIDTKARFFNQIMDLALIKRGIILLESIFYSTTIEDRGKFNLKEFLKNCNEFTFETEANKRKIDFPLKTNYLHNAKRSIVNKDEDINQLLKSRFDYLCQLEHNFLILLGDIFKQHLKNIPYNNTKSRNQSLKELYFYCYRYLNLTRNYSFESAAFNRNNSDFLRKYVFH